MIYDLCTSRHFPVKPRGALVLGWPIGVDPKDLAVVQWDINVYKMLAIAIG